MQDALYNVSFKISDIVNNPLNANYSNIKIIVPGGQSTNGYEVVGTNRVIFKNVRFNHGTSYNAA